MPIGIIPGYTPPGGFSVQNHMHLGAYQSSDGAMPVSFGTTDNAPPYLFTHVEVRTPIFDAQADFQRAWDGTPFDHVVRDSTLTNPITFFSIHYGIRTDLFGLDILKNLFMRRVYLVDSIHCPNGTDHSPYQRLMWMNELTYQENLDPILAFNEVEFTLIDFNTVKPVAI